MDTLGGFANLSAVQLRDLTGASLATVRRWKRYLELIYRGTLELIRPQWAGWTLRGDGKLHSPEGPAFALGEIRAIPLHHARIRELQCELRDLRKSATAAAAPANSLRPRCASVRHAARYNQA